MRNIVMAAATALMLVIGIGPSFAGGSSSIQSQSANIQAGGEAYPAGVAHHHFMLRR